jgi:hypothetical protein
MRMRNLDVLRKWNGKPGQWVDEGEDEEEKEEGGGKEKWCRVCR